MSIVHTKEEGAKRPIHLCIGLFAVIFVTGCTSSPSDGPGSAASAIGTPFLVALKVPSCVATVVVAGPAAALQQLAAPNEDGLQPDIRPALDAGIDENCGPPYVVVPR